MRLVKIMAEMFLLVQLFASCIRPSVSGVVEMETKAKFDLVNNYALSSMDFQKFYDSDDILQQFIKEQCSGEKKLLLLFAETACPACIKVEIDNLNNALDSSQVVLLYAADSQRYLKILQRENRFSFPVLQLPSISPEINEYLSRQPVYLFSSQSDMSYVFLPNKNNIPLTVNYLKFIKAFFYLQ